MANEPDGDWPEGGGEPVAIASLPWEEAWLYAGRLQSEGIPARVYPDYGAPPISIGQVFGASDILPGIGLGRSRFDVLVPTERAEEARRILEQIETEE